MIYVENVCWVMLDEDKKQGKTFYTVYIILEVEASMSIDISPAYIREDSTFLRKSKKTLLMFRRL
jgi:hypothetical protein